MNDYSALFNSFRAQEVVLCRRLPAKDGVVMFSVEDLHTTLWSFFIGLLESLHSMVTNSGIETFLVSSIDGLFHTITVVDDVNLRLFESCCMGRW